MKRAGLVSMTCCDKTMTQALKGAEGHRLKVNREQSLTEPTFGALIERFILDERLRDAKNGSRPIGITAEEEEFDPEALDPSTASSYLSMLHVHIGRNGKVFSSRK